MIHTLPSVETQQGRATLHGRIECVQTALQLLSRLRILEAFRRMGSPVAPKPTRKIPNEFLAMEYLTNENSLQELIGELGVAMRKSAWLMESAEAAEAALLVRDLAALT